MSLAQRAYHSARIRSRHAFEQRVVRRLALTAMVRRTNNFATVTWLGRPMWQNIADAFMIQQVLVEEGVDLVIECGTNRGGSAFFMASLFDQLDDRDGHVVTIDVESMVDFSHPRITFLLGSTIDQTIVATVREIVAARQPTRTLVILDSDHSAPHVLAEAHVYAGFLEVGSYMLVQDGAIDELHSMCSARPGPLRAVEQFVREDGRFEVDQERSERYLTSHSPSGWLRRAR